MGILFLWEYLYGNILSMGIFVWEWRGGNWYFVSLYDSVGRATTAGKNYAVLRFFSFIMMTNTKSRISAGII